eukprot:3617248-Rhodomonas_salina.2
MGVPETRVWEYRKRAYGSTGNERMGVPKPRVWEYWKRVPAYHVSVLHIAYQICTTRPRISTRKSVVPLPCFSTAHCLGYLYHYTLSRRSERSGRYKCMLPFIAYVMLGKTLPVRCTIWQYRTRHSEGVGQYECVLLLCMLCFSTGLVCRA